MTVILEPFGINDIDEACHLGWEIGWPHTKQDWRFASSVGTGLVAREDDRLVATCMTWQLTPQIATLGLLIVAPESQRRGLGRTVLRSCLDRLSGHTVILHATVEGIELYRSEGFSPSGQVGQFQGIVADGLAEAKVSRADDEGILRHSTDTDHRTIVSLDRKATGFDRSLLLTAILENSTGVVLEENGETTGYALCRRFGLGQAIGPVVAPDQPSARQLVSTLLMDKTEQFVRLDVPEGALSADWLARCGMPKVSGVIAMANGPLPKVSEDLRKFALIGHAFG